MKRYADAEPRYFALVLRRIQTLTAFGLREETCIADLPRRHAKFLNCLMNSRDERLTYDLRITSRPDPTLYSRGSVTPALFCRADDLSAREAEDHANQLLVVISTRLRPTSLKPEEETFLEEQIARCERALQTGLQHGHEDLGSLRPSLREKAALYEQFQSRQLFGLSDNDALVYRVISHDNILAMYALGGDAWPTGPDPSFWNKPTALNWNGCNGHPARPPVSLGGHVRS